MQSYGREKVPTTHEFGLALNNNFQHFVALQERMAKTIHEWKGCGSYLVNGQNLDYCEAMWAKQCALYDVAKTATHAFEIGIHGGHSLLIMLLANPTLRITCIDVCIWAHTKQCVEYLRSAFPDARITLYEGKSTDVMPSILDELRDVDLAHVDGAHEIAVIEKEVEYLRQVMNIGTTIVFDDYVTPHLSNAIHKKWNTFVEVLQVPDCIYTNCITRVCA